MKKNIPIEQKSLFSNSQKTHKVSSFLSQSPSNYKPAPDVSLTAGLNKATLKTDGVYLLRVLANQYNRTLPASSAKKKLLNTVETEINIKKGKIPIEIALMDALLKKHF